VDTATTPVARQAEQMTREGVPSSRATLNRIFLRAGNLLSPLAHMILQRIVQSELVLADETPMRQQDQDSKGYFWVFSNEQLSAYVYSSSRSGETPKNVLGNSKGDLVVDGYTGYNQVTTPDKRRRSGCNAHYLESAVIWGNVDGGTDFPMYEDRARFRTQDNAV
jgi:transposase